MFALNPQWPEEKKMTLQEIATLFNITCPQDIQLSGICIDSRKVNSGDLFVAIEGERFDGHQFVATAEAQGAAAILCTRKMNAINIPQLVVPDTVQALARIAAYHRSKMNCAVIALTGSNGKTTVKEMIASILPEPSFATPGNLNNHIGAPLSILQLQPEHRYAVFELGASHEGDIAHTVAIVQPQVALINNIALPI
jgi:UDP-N-acetylmuramoyl-tripeptide--D-alanyl-D-alanine ligase